MKKILLLLLLLLATNLFAKQLPVLIDVGGGALATILVEVREEPIKMVKFIIGSEFRDRRGISAKSVKVIDEIEEGASISSKDMLENVKSVCLQIFVDNGYYPISGKCSPVIDKKYPVIEIESGKIPDEKFKARLVGYNYSNNYWDNMNNGNIIANTNEKIFESLFIQLGIDKVYMGSLYASGNMKSNMSFYDSENKIEFTNFSKIYLVSDNGYKQSVINSSKDDSYTYADFWIETDIIYNKICFDDTCYQIDEGFDFFYPNIDVSTLNEVEMIPVIGEDVCSVIYNQDFKNVIDVTDNNTANKSYNSVTIQDCNKDYTVRVIADTYRNLSTRTYVNGDYTKSLYASQVKLETSTENRLAWFDIEYGTTDMKVDGLVFRPKMIIEIVDPETNEVVQTNKFDMTEFEFVGTGGSYCNQYMQEEGECQMVNLDVSANKEFGYKDNQATLGMNITNHTDQPVIIEIKEYSSDHFLDFNINKSQDLISILTTSYSDDDIYLSSITFVVSFDGDGDQDYIEPYEIKVNVDTYIGSYNDVMLECDPVMEALGMCQQEVAVNLSINDKFGVNDSDAGIKFTIDYLGQKEQLIKLISMETSSDLLYFDGNKVVQLGQIEFPIDISDNKDILLVSETLNEEIFINSFIYEVAGIKYEKDLGNKPLSIGVYSN